MQTLKLITENDFWGDYEIIKENVEGKPRQIKLRGPFMQAEKENMNKRRYPYDEMKKEADRFNEQFIQTGRALGELEHPDYAYINSERAAQRIISLKEGDNKTFIGESIILATDSEHNIKGTPLGDIAASLIQYGTKLGQSTRGVGRLEDGVVHEYKLSTVDVVSDPSIGDFVEGILESKDFMVDTHGLVTEMCYDRLTGKLDNLPNHKRSEYVSEALKDFLSKIV
jgi:hypothetical protein